MTDIELPRLLRLKHILGDTKANPPIEPIIPISKVIMVEWGKEWQISKAYQS